MQKRLTLFEALRFCEVKGLAVTRQALYSSVSDRDEEGVFFYEDKLTKYVEGRTANAPAGWISTKEAMETYGIKSAEIQYLFKTGRLEKRIYGREGKRTPHVSAEKIKEYQEHRRSTRNKAEG